MVVVQFEEGDIINNKITVVEKLGEGGFGAVYKVTLEGHANQVFAMKSEQRNAGGVLKMEVMILRKLEEKRGTHFCRCVEAGCAGNMLYLVMTMLGKSLSDIRMSLPGTKLSMGCALGVGKQCVEAIRELHGIGYLHRDLKPSNFACGAEKNSRKIFLFDFGLARRYLAAGGKMRQPRLYPGFRGTARYAPLSCHVQREQSRKCDLESWLYQQVELTRGGLPWRSFEVTEMIGMYKERCRFGVGLKEFLGGCPREYVEVLRYIDRLRYHDAPNYKYLIACMDRAMKSIGLSEFPYDWEESSPLYSAHLAGLDAMAEEERKRLERQERKAARNRTQTTAKTVSLFHET
ncbi:unnamed protein product [Bursaphelenchus xylophilus]|uniref:(pine wood nematode) hypothetical protein n=1 Tax=Bursaphelenchus xylophilus TaxID=6326 RepID=A0A1I7RVZ6_BURXY|nr:unnamed protein product [Bursaphelenchus xylophilus]CAG9094921.1 unnamed protein product [Bursaphelenchus xylophilus]